MNFPLCVVVFGLASSVDSPPGDSRDQLEILHFYAHLSPVHMLSLHGCHFSFLPMSRVQRQAKVGVCG